MSWDFRESYLAFFQVGLGFASQRSQISFEEADLTELDPHCAEVDQPLFGVDDGGFQREAIFDQLVHKASVDETIADVGDWPVGAELALPGPEARPGGFVVTLTAPLGGRELDELGRQFREYVVSWLCWNWL